MSDERTDKAKALYEVLMGVVLVEIDRIDKATPYQNTEPQWWLDMMAVERLIRTQKQTPKGE